MRMMYQQIVMEMVFSDAYELSKGSDPEDPDSIPEKKCGDGNGPGDGSGPGTGPCKIDSDGDGFDDTKDGDIDGDGWHNNDEEFNNTDPLDSSSHPTIDTDGDYVSDSFETSKNKKS